MTSTDLESLEDDSTTEEEEQDEEDIDVGDEEQHEQDEDEGQQQQQQQQQQDRSAETQQEKEEREFLEQQQRQSTQRQIQRPASVKRQMESSGRSKGRAPRASVTVDPIERYSEIDKPSDQYRRPGDEPSRMEQIMETGELVPYNRKQLIKEYGKMQAWKNAYVSWQAQRDDYVIYQNAGYDEEKGADKWVAAHYQLYPLTTGQHFRIDAMNARLNDLKRAAQNNDKDVKDVYNEIRKTEINIVKLKLELYFRLHVGRIDPKSGVTDDPDDEFEYSSWADVRDNIESAEWAFQWVPKWRRIKPSVDSGSKADKELSMIR